MTIAVVINFLLFPSVRIQGELAVLWIDLLRFTALFTILIWLSKDSFLGDSAT